MPKRTNLYRVAFLACMAFVGLGFQGVAAASRVSKATAVPPATIQVFGTPVPGGCNFQGTNTVAPGESGSVQHETAVNMSTCIMTMEQTATPTAPGGATPGTSNGAQPYGSSSASSSGTASVGANPTPTTIHAPLRRLSAAADVQESAGFTYTDVLDPVDITVNSQKNTIDWFWNGSDLEGTENCGSTWQWFWLSGWYVNDTSLACFITTDNQQVYSSSYAAFQNDIFCGVTDKATYWYNDAIGYANGTLVGEWDVELTGDCSGLLSVNNDTERTMN